MMQNTVGRPQGSMNKLPKNIKRVRDVLRRRAAGESWSAIGRIHGISRMGAKLLHDRWVGAELPN